MPVLEPSDSPGLGSQVLSSSFWAKFAENHWEKRPLVIRQSFSRPILTSAEVFRGLVRAARDRDKVSSGHFRFYNEQARQEADLWKYLPAPSDRSLARYVTRVGRQLRGRRFGLIVHDYQVHDARTWLRLRDFLRGCFLNVGQPVPWIDAAVFIGNYDNTPFGVHRDEHSTFLFVIEGTKRILAWPEDAFRKNSGINLSLAYDRYRGDAIKLEAEPGDIIYWPKTHWHVAESTGGLSVTLHVSIDPEMDSGDDLARHVLRLVDASLKSNDGKGLYSFNPGAMAEATQRSADISRRTAAALRQISESRTLADDLLIVWLRRLTSGGFHSVPPPQPNRPLTDTDIVRGDPNSPVAWVRKKSEIICAANGHCFSVASNRFLPKLIERINSGDPFCIKAACNGALSPKAVRTFLEKLQTLRVITPQRRRLRPARISRSQLSG